MYIYIYVCTHRTINIFTQLNLEKEEKKESTRTWKIYLYKIKFTD